MTMIAIDLDDTLVDTMSALLDWIETSYGFRVDEEKLAAYQIGADTSQTDAIVKAFHSDQADRKIRALDGAAEACRCLTGAGFKLAVVTSRKPDISAHTIDLVDRLFPGTFSEIHSVGYPSDKSTKLQEIKAALFIDDHFRHIEVAAAAGIPSILFRDLPWNRKMQWSHRAFTWPEALTLSGMLLRND